VKGFGRRQAALHAPVIHDHQDSRSFFAQHMLHRGCCGLQSSPSHPSSSDGYPSLPDMSARASPNMKSVVPSIKTESRRRRGTGSRRPDHGTSGGRMRPHGCAALSSEVSTWWMQRASYAGSGRIFRHSPPRYESADWWPSSRLVKRRPPPMSVGKERRLPLAEIQRDFRPRARPQSPPLHANKREFESAASARAKCGSLLRSLILY
jgi:hypothetical protein